MKKIIAANWKMYVDDRKQASELFNLANKIKTKHIELIFCPPFPYLSASYSFISRFRQPLAKSFVKLGAQDVSWQETGAHTGEVSPRMLKNLGVKYVIIGHSEKRIQGETDEIINKKIKAALNNNLKVILCVGENLKIRRRGLKTVKKFMASQLKKGLEGISAGQMTNSKLIIAYEPIWAIYPGKPDTPEDSLKMVKFIKNLLENKMHKLKIKILYGGSVTSKNIADFIRYPEIDGVLIGHASTDVKEFKKILEESVSKQSKRVNNLK